MLHPKLYPVLEHRCLLGEGPVWDADRQRILWLDILQGHIHQYDPAIDAHNVIDAGEMIGAICLSSKGSVIAAMKSGFAGIDLDTGKIQPIANPESHMTGNRFNDGKCDPAGNFWAGTMSLTDHPAAGGLYVLRTDGLAEKRLSDISISNGLAWSPDDKTFYYIDTPTHQVVAYDYDVSEALISNPRVVVRIPDDFGGPDGMTIDTEGMLWIAHWDGWQITRWNPATGELLMQLHIPTARVTSCTFGGDQLQDLYITTASVGLSPEQLLEQPLAGALLVIRDCGFRGIPPDRFRN